MKRQYKFILFYIALFSILISEGFAAKEQAPEKLPEPTKTNHDRYEGLGLFNKVLYFIEQNYVEDIKNKDLIKGALQGMLQNLDPHSDLLTGEIYKEMKIDTSGKFGGIGLEVALKDSILTVVTPIDDTPAFKAGIKPGDRIVKIDGKSTKGLGLSQAVEKMRGKKGEAVTLTIWRDGFNKPKEFIVNRADIKIQAVRSEILEPGYLYLRLASFNEQATKDLQKAMDQFEKNAKSGGTIRGLILDLRNNPGGLLEQAIGVSSLFIDDGVIVSTRGRSAEAQEVKRAIPGMARKHMPMAILVNGASASAAEIVAGALQDHKRAVIFGQTTFGKGSVQTFVELSPEMGLKLTVARYFTPKGRSIQAKGIQPDVYLEELDQKVLEQASRKQDYRHEKDLDRHIDNPDNDEDGFRTEELIALDKQDEAKKAKQAENKEKGNEETKTVAARDDYQVHQALNYMKSFKMLQALNLGTLDTEPTQTKAEAKKTDPKKQD